MKLDLLVALKVLLAQKDVEVGGLLDRDVDLVWVLGTTGIGLDLIDVLLHIPLCPFLL